MVFEQWPEGLTPSCRRVVDPPTPVRVRLAEAIARGRLARANELPLRVRAGGADLDATVDGLVHAWMRTSRGDWLALVECTIHTSNKAGQVEIRQWCPADALEPGERSGG